jgi:hypothetical protein
MEPAAGAAASVTTDIKPVTVAVRTTASRLMTMISSPFGQ